jgi:hypothetical protein
MAGKSKGQKEAVAELVALLPELDEEGLAFLLEQAKVHLHNMEIDRLQRAETLSVQRGSKSGSKRPSTGIGRRSATPGFRVERADDGETYHLVSGGVWKMFTDAEMAAIVTIVRGEGDEAELARRLHSWFERERRDALSDFFLGSEPGTLTLELVRTLRKTFSGKKK